ncbi:ORF6N domain-containing protein [uncultured Mucilaginibacter sp.]|uniref:ORF6N domain-containing protein n=1 Tax=uncultured Mucilaginibacter sp. TaxID=797541 RepID=UPI0025E085DD|nr:ORF6N domain-containing protein [uncultured Mucilaginibacter sp.]
MEKNKTDLAETKIPDEVIVDKIILLRDKKVMIDRDLAILYGITTKRLNEQVKRNSRRFPDDFMFQITQIEKDELIRTFEHLDSLKYSPVLPFVFTEHGAVMLASVLNSDQAIAVNIQIVKVFTRIREMLADNTELRLDMEKIKARLNSQDKNIELVFHYLDELLEKKDEEPKPRNPIGFKLG